MKKQLGILLLALMIAVGVTGIASAFKVSEKPCCKPVIVPACKPVCIEICKPKDPNNAVDPPKHVFKKPKHAFDPAKKCDTVKPKCDPVKKCEIKKCDPVKPKCEDPKPVCEPVCKLPVCNGGTPPVNT